jgi:hypothetical protein
MLYVSDSSRVWHVSKSGNDSNSGHAGQYPVNLTNDAKLTIGAAVNAAQSGDVIIIWPGDYAENVNLGTKAITLVGIHRAKSRIVPASGTAVSVSNDCCLRNLAAEGLAGTDPKGMDCMNKQNVVIDSCDIYGGYDGIYGYGTKYLWLNNCRIRGKYDGGNLSNTENVIATNCIFHGLGTYGTNVPCRGIWGAGQGSYRSCIFKAERSDVSSAELAALKLSGGNRAVFSNCIFETSAGASHTGGVYGLVLYDGSSVAVLNNCSLRSASAGTPSNGPYDLYQSAGDIIISNCRYSTKHGTIIQEGTGWSAAVKGELTGIGLDKAAKMLLNKAVQDKLSGVIQYYDDNGQTVILTHTPSEDGSSFTRTVS